MNISEQWLREWINTRCDIGQLTEQLTMAGLEVEKTQTSMPRFSGVVVAKIEHIEDHHKSAKFKLCQISTGDKDKQPTQVVCSAKNIRVGLYTAFASIGATLAKDIEIQARSYEGVVSQGRLCSMADLGLADESEGVMTLQEDLTIGADLADMLALDDQIITLSLTPNRGDCLSILGVARELSAINRLPFKPTINVSNQQNELVNTQHRPRKIIIEQIAACPRYVAQVIEGVDVTKPSPLWLSERLRRCGLKSINVVVDIINYVMFEIGQPMHAYDDDTLQGDIVIRYAQQDEPAKFLNGQECTLSADTLVIADRHSVLGIAGVIGSYHSAVTTMTHNIFLESAFFEPLTILGKARQYGLNTESAHRFERGVDYMLQKSAIAKATELIIEICGGKPHPIIEKASQTALPQAKKIKLRNIEIIRLLGINLADREIVAILSSLGMTVEAMNEGWSVIPPSFRFDINIEVDLIEEIARIYGYQNIKPQLPLSQLKMYQPNACQRLIKDMRELLVNRGFTEVVNYSFVDPKLLDMLVPNIDALTLVNPIASELSTMRTSLLPGLVNTAIYNQNRQQQKICLFEIGQVFRIEKEIVQPTFISGIILSNYNIKQWGIEYKSSDLFDLKKVVELLCALGHITELKLKIVQRTTLHPGQSANIIHADQTIGFIGTLHPSLQAKLALKQDAFVFELELNNILEEKDIKHKEISKFPSIKRDISIIVSKDIPVADIFDLIKKTAGDLLYNVQLFDMYQGEIIDSEKKSLSFSLIFSQNSSTLRDQVVDEITETVLAKIKTHFNALLRE